jgi:translation initiation factor 4B
VSYFCFDDAVAADLTPTPEKERSGFGGGGGFDDDAKFANPWRRDGPLPDLPGRDGDRPRQRFEGGERTGPPPSVSDNVDQWRSSKPSPRITSRDLDGPPLERRRSGFQSTAEPGAADAEETWSRGSRFKPAEEPPAGASRFGGGAGGGFRRGDMGPPRERDAPPHSATDEPETWRTARPARLSSREQTV